ncbi:hypothetical protein [Citrobacter sp. wls827]|uniref:hypothetical protein n=1 Tax=Citrobacter TaxID=544 RepID=UPI0010C9CB80|nr:hypothetical protein [Citrobacter sp. wls827]TKU17393.1 hypothetical protein FDX03_12285 [Citrobacter sp. wls827]
MSVNVKVKRPCLGILIVCAVIAVSGCSSLIAKAERNADERAQKFSNDELCKHAREDGNMYYAKANAK